MACVEENLKLTSYLKRYNLLHSKITIPESAPHCILRNQCLQQLNTQGWQIATLIAPAGFGKSNIVRQYINDHSSVCWLSIDKDENHTHRFLYYLVAALKSINVDNYDGLIDSIRQLNDNLCIFADRLLHEIAEREDNLLIVLDDFHHINNIVLHSFLQYFINNAPKNIQLVITSREKLPLKTARLRADKKLIEIERDQLRFNAEEISGLLQSFYHQDITSAQIENAEFITEGWPAALQLLCMSSDNLEELSENLHKENKENFSYKHIKEYIREEILPAYDTSTVQFLLKISILSSFTPALCNHLAETDNALDILETVEKQNSLLIALDKKNRWFRFHNLFGDVLTEDLERFCSPQEKANLHKMASHWYENNGYLQEAIDHAIQSGDLIFVDTFLDRNAETRIFIGQLNQLFEWFAKIERGNIKLPMVNIWIAWVNIFSHKVDTNLIASLTADAIAIYESDANNAQNCPAFIAHTTAIKGFVATYNGQFEEGISFSLQALEELKNQNNSLRSGIVFNLSRSYFFLGDLSKTIEYADQATKLGFECNNYYCAVASVNLKAQALMQLMDFEKAELAYNECLENITKGKLNRHPINGYIFNGLGEIQLYRNNINDAKALVLTGLNFCEQGKETRSLLQANKLICQIYQTEGDTQHVLMHAENLNSILHEISADISMREISAFQIDLELLANNYSNESNWEEKLNNIPESSFTTTREYEHFVLTSVFIHQNRLDEALTIINKLIEQAEKLQRLLSLTNFYLRKSNILLLQGLALEAIPFLIKGLDLCNKSGIELPYQNAKKWLPFESPTSIAGQQGADFIELLKTRSPAEKIRSQKHLLTSKELEIMQHVKAGLSNKQISLLLNITEGTVKRHVHNIFSKLNVKNRIEAIQMLSVASDINAKVG